MRPNRSLPLPVRVTANLKRIVAAVVLLCSATANADNWARTSNVMDYAVFAGGGSSAEGDVGPYVGGQLGFCILCLYINTDRFTIGDSHSIYYGYPLGGAIAEGVVMRYGLSDKIDVGARLLYQLYGNRGGGKQGPVGVLEGRWERITGSVTFFVNRETYLEGAVRYMLDEIYGLKLHIIHTEGTELRLSYGGYLF